MPRPPRATWLAIGAIAAALLGPDGVLDVGIGPAPWLALGTALVAAALLGLARRRPGLATGLLGLGLVGLRLAFGTVLAPAELAAPLPVGSGAWQGVVAGVSSPSGDRQRAFLALEDGDAGRWLVYAWLPRHPSLVPGDRVVVEGSLEAPPGDAPGFAGFLAARGAVGTLTATLLERRAGDGSAMAAVEHLRRAIDDALGRAVPEPEAGLAAGILVGLRERVAGSVSDDFTTTGLTHVVAISGWNIALVAGIVTGLLRAAGLARRPRSVVVILAIVAYTLVAGASASVIRAALMGGLVLLAREGGRPAHAASALALACAGLLLADPGMVTDVGLQLSLAATAGLLALGGPAEAAVRRHAPNATPGWLVETLGVSLAAQLATLPLVLFHFGRLSLISPFANVLMAPLVPMAMLGAALGALSGPLVWLPVVDLLIVPLRLAAWLPLAGMVRGAGLLADIPFASLELPPGVDVAGALLALAALALALLRARPAGGGLGERSRDPGPPAPGRRVRGRRGVVIGAVGLWCGVLVMVLVPRSAGRVSISVLDVGQGDAILVEASEGPRLLVDGGSDPDLLVRRLDERIPLWDRRVDLVVLSHPHEDHVGGLAGLAPRYRVARIGESGIEAEGSGVRELHAMAARHGIDQVRLGQGAAFRLGQARVDVVWPPPGSLQGSPPTTNREVNDTSVVLAISLGAQHALLLGDLEDDRDAQLLAAMGASAGRWDLLKVAHHGSATATSDALLAALRPRLAAISVGAGNDYGHPAPDLLARLETVGATIWRTDEQGTLTVTFDGLAEGRAGRSDLPVAVAPGRALRRVACYARLDGGPDANRSPCPPPVHQALRATRAARHGGRRGGLLPGPPRTACRSERGPPPRRDGRAPPRHRQGPARRRPPS